MLGLIGRWAQSKGMKLIPNWVGVNKNTAATQIVTEGFVVGTATPVETHPTDDAAKLPLSNTVIATTPTANALVDYETVVNYTYQQFTFTPFGVFGFTPYGFTPFAVFGFSPFSPYTGV
jgi:hypothetical protein